MPDSTNASWIFVDEEKKAKEGAIEKSLSWVEVGVPAGTTELEWEFRSDWIGSSGKKTKAATFKSVKAFVEGFLDEKAKKQWGGRLIEEQLKEVRDHGTLFVKRSLPVGYENDAKKRKEAEVPPEKLLLPAFVVDLVLCRYCSGVRRAEGKKRVEGKSEDKEGEGGEEGEEGQRTSLIETLVPIVMILFFAILFCASAAVILYIGLLTIARDSVRDSSTYSAQYVSLINDVLKFILRKESEEEDDVGQCVTSY